MSDSSPRRQSGARGMKGRKGKLLHEGALCPIGIICEAHGCVAHREGVVFREERVSVGVFDVDRARHIDVYAVCGRENGAEAG